MDFLPDFTVFGGYDRQRAKQLFLSPVGCF
jgi:hypothetical protein